MLYHLLFPLSDEFGVLNVFRYITFRAAYATITALLISFLLGPWVIARLQQLRVGQKIREEGPSSHQSKAGTPTMGGILILIAIVVPTLLWANLSNESIWIMIFTTIGLGLTGFLDDYLRVVKQVKSGLMGRYKLLSQFLVGLCVGVSILLLDPFGADVAATATSIPFLKERMLDLGWFYVPFVIFIVTATSNAVNLSDGLDGLAIGLLIPPAATFGVFAYMSGHTVFADYLNLTYLEGAGELTVYAGALVGAALGFLWYNCHPAQVFMGDTGSLALGGSLGVLAILVKRELLLALVGGIFVMITLSVMIQVLSFRIRGKRVFKMAPLHHHFELSGWPETHVVVRFWILGILLGLVTLSTVKLQ